MPLSHEQKLFFVAAIAVVAFSGMFLSLRQLSRRLQIAVAGPSVPVGQQLSPVVEALKKKDTDGDGLSDYDELFVYHTSPYLKDTDSDGIPDGQEVKNGTDPNCPEGKNCLNLGALSSPTSPAPLSPSVVSPTPQVIAPPTAASLPGLSQAPSSDMLVNLLSGNVTAQELRAFLKQQGARDEDLARIDDAALLKLYTQALTQADAQQSGNTPAPDASGSAVNPASPSPGSAPAKKNP